jgi:hypothetical protein
MRFVFTQFEVANALQIEETLFSQILPLLYENGFPQPLKVLNERWSIFEVMNWVNKQNDDAEKPAAPGKRVPSTVIN